MLHKNSIHYSLYERISLLVITKGIKFNSSEVSTACFQPKHQTDFMPCFDWMFVHLWSVSALLHVNTTEHIQWNKKLCHQQTSTQRGLDELRFHWKLQILQSETATAAVSPVKTLSSFLIDLNLQMTFQYWRATLMMESAKLFSLGVTDVQIGQCHVPYFLQQYWS